MKIIVNPETDLVLERIVDVTPEQIWEAWTTPELLKQWFCPKPWRVDECSIDLRPGGIFTTTMRGPEGQENKTSGCYLELIPNVKLVFTDSLGADFHPTQNSFMTGTIHLEKHAKGCKYVAYAFHKDAATKKQHEEMGFKDGWGKALDQMVELIKSRPASHL